MNRKSIFILTALILALAAAFTGAPCAFAANGTLTQDTDGYYLIEDEKDLAAFSEGVNNGTLASANARLTADIDLSIYKDWTPIGDSANPYAGTFDGRRHAIKGLAVNITSSDGVANVYAGLFGNISGTVKNLEVSGTVTVDISGDGNIYAGGVAAAATSGVIENCKSSVTVDVKGEDRRSAGGIVGEVSDATIINCESSGSVKLDSPSGSSKSYAQAGGIAGTISGGLITNCASSSSVTVGNSMGVVGGIAGAIASSNSTVSNCTSTADITLDGSGAAGGIVGHHTQNGILINCVVAGGSVKGEGSAIGAVAGMTDGVREDAVENCAFVKSENLPENGIGSDNSGNLSANVTEIADASMMDAAVTSLSASITPSPITVGQTATITFTLSPNSPDGAFDKSTGAVRDIQFSGYDTNVITEITEGAEAGTYTVTTGTAGSTEIKIAAKFYATDFSTLPSTPAYTTNPTDFALTLPVTVTAEPAPSQPGSGSTGGGGGGCSAGFGALALLAAVPLLFHRKK